MAAPTNNASKLEHPRVVVALLLDRIDELDQAVKLAEKMKSSQTVPPDHVYVVAPLGASVLRTSAPVLTDTQHVSVLQAPADGGPAASLVALLNGETDSTTLIITQGTNLYNAFHLLTDMRTMSDQYVLLISRVILSDVPPSSPPSSKRAPTRLS
jgi:hypothetical protein